MSKSTREEIRNRTAPAGSFTDKLAVSLEEEAARIKAEIEAGDVAPTPAQEVEQEAQAATAKPPQDARPGQRIGQQSPHLIAHTKEVALVVESAYKQFLLLGHGPETARSLASTYGILELTIVLNKIIGKV